MHTDKDVNSQLVKFQGNDGFTVTPDDKTTYTLAFRTFDYLTVLSMAQVSFEFPVNGFSFSAATGFKSPTAQAIRITEHSFHSLHKMS